MAKLSKKPASAQANADPTKASSDMKPNVDTGKTVAKRPKHSALNQLFGKGKGQEKEQEREKNEGVQTKQQQKILAERRQGRGPRSATQLTSIDESGEVETNTFHNGFFKSSLKSNQQSEC